MKKEDIKELTDQELQDKIKEEKVFYRKLRFNHEVGQLENTNRLKKVKVNIVRYHTELKERQMAESQETEKKQETKNQKQTTKS